MVMVSGYQNHSPLPFSPNPTPSSTQLPLQMIRNCTAFSRSSSSSSSFPTASIASTQGRKLPILLFDVMDTVVRDPFYHYVPAFFRMSLKELMDCKHPTAWSDFEKGLITEIELSKKFFKDGRSFDLEGLKTCLRSGYSYIEGVAELLGLLRQSNYEMHAFTNYPVWYGMIEDKLKLSTFMSWTFCSCTTGKRKPEPDSYLEVLKHLKVESASCIFIDDRLRNVEAARDAGIIGVHFKNADMLRNDLSLLGIDI